MTDSSVTLDSGLVVDFDYAIVNSGVHIPFFLDSDKPVQEGDRKNIIKDKNAEIAKSKNIVISGGGAVSVEIASDIKLRNKNTSVTLVIPRTAVLEKMTEKYQVLALARLKEIGVVIVDNDRVTGHEGGKVNLKSSKTLPADMYFPCHATKVNSEFVPAASLDSKKYVMVEETFLVKGMKNVFATGDVTDRPVKGGFAAQEYAKHIVNNLANAIAGKPLQVSYTFKGLFLFLYTVDTLFHVEWCTGKPWYPFYHHAIKYHLHSI